MTFNIKNWKEEYQDVKTEFYFLIVVMFVIFSLGWHFLTAPKSFDEIFDEAIFEYEHTNNKIIYPYGRNCLKNAAIKQKLTTKEQIQNLIIHEMKNK